MSETAIVPSFWPIQGQWFGKSHWEEVKYECHDEDGSFECSGLRDKTTGLIYLNSLTNSPCVLRVKALAVAAYAIPYLTIVIAYHVIRLVVVSVYYVCKAIFYAIKQTPDTEKRPKIFAEWVDATKVSLKGIVRAPFYGIAMFFGSLYMFFDPLNGRKIVGAYEFEWNHKVPLKQSLHIFLPHPDFSLKPFLQGKGGYYVPGCFQPVATSNVETGVVFKPYKNDETWGDSKILENKTISWLTFCVI